MGRRQAGGKMRGAWRQAAKSLQKSKGDTSKQTNKQTQNKLTPLLAERHEFRVHTGKVCTGEDGKWGRLDGSVGCESWLPELSQ